MAETCKPAVKKRGPRVTDAEIKEALTASRGILTVASAWIAKNKGKQIRHQSLSERISKSKHLQRVRREVEETNLDFAESKLYELLAKGDKTALIFYLKCKGKHRGWVERSEVTGKEGRVIEIASNTVDITKLPEEELRNLEQILSKAEANTASNT